MLQKCSSVLAKSVDHTIDQWQNICIPRFLGDLHQWATVASQTVIPIAFTKKQNNNKGEAWEKEEHLDTTQNAYHINKSEYEREKYDFFATQKICAHRHSLKLLKIAVCFLSSQVFKILLLLPSPHSFLFFVTRLSQLSLKDWGTTVCHA